MASTRIDTLKGSVDPVLTDVMLGYMQNPNAFVGKYAMPFLPVDTMEGHIYQFNRDHMRIFDTLRASGAPVKRIQLSNMSKVDYECQEHSFEMVYDWQEEDAAKKIYNLEEALVLQGSMIIDLEVEYDIATLLQDTDQYDTGNKVALTSNDCWDTGHADSTPLTDIQTGINRIRTTSGKRGNVVIIGEASFNVLKTHTQITELIKYSERGLVNEDVLSALLSTQDNQVKVYIGSGQYFNGTTNVDLWGDMCWIGYVPQSTMEQRSMFEPSFGYTPIKKGYPQVKTGFVDWTEKIRGVNPTLPYVPKICMADAGYLITNTIT